jgi:hypothetical protein
MSSYDRDFGHIPNSQLRAACRVRRQLPPGKAPRAGSHGRQGRAGPWACRPARRPGQQSGCCPGRAWPLLAHGREVSGLAGHRQSQTGRTASRRGRRFPAPAPSGLIPLPHGRPHPARRSAACRAPPRLHLDPGRAQRAAVCPEAAPPRRPSAAPPPQPGNRQPLPGSAARRRSRLEPSCLPPAKIISGVALVALANDRGHKIEGPGTLGPALGDLGPEVVMPGSREPCRFPVRTKGPADWWP